MLGNGETAAGYAFRTNRGAILQALFSAAQGRFLRFVIEHTFAARMARRRSNRGGGQPGGGCDTDPAGPGPARPSPAQPSPARHRPGPDWRFVRMLLRLVSGLRCSFDYPLAANPQS
ncbi:hypothetical protein [Burkholderia mallei]|uniref:hypothetical protein n=1 Tax=Burkholderia mallei TaxID=13373 RepID=UPI001C4FD195|nr:hypothetical protein [Burkholderia mallei]